MMCRTYIDGGRPAGLPPPEWIRAAVREARWGIMRVTDKLTPMAAAMSALATLACCLPLRVAGAVGALGLSVALERLRPWLIGLAVILLGVSAFQIVFNTLPGQFLNRDFTDSGIRNMWVQVKLVF
jgi:hypothetical protein